MVRTRTKQHIGGYRVIAPIGVGASATVYRALNEQTRDEVAIKVLAENFSLLPEMRQRFLDEVELLRSIDSPSVAKIYSLGETDSGQPYMVLELADRGDLHHRLEDLRIMGKAPTRADLLALADHLAESLSALHRADIIHRDVSPGNVLIRTGGPGSKPTLAKLAASKPALESASVLEPGERYSLADLGFAKDLEYASGLTAGGGTRGFAAPEQRDDVTIVDHRADVFSATAVMEWMAQGSGLVGDLELFFDSGLATDPDRRFDSMEDWLRALHRALGVEAVEPVGTSSGETAPSSERAMGSKLLVASVGVVVVAGLAVAAFGLRPSPLVDDTGEQTVAAPSVDSADGADGADRAESTSDSDQAASEEATLEGASSRGTAEGTGPEAEPANPSEDTTASTSSTTSPEESAPSSTAPNGSATTVAPTTTVPSSTTSTTSAGPTSAPETTAPPRTAPSSTVTTQALTTTTFNPIFAESPRAYVQSPADEAIVSGDLRITGTAEYRGGITGVNLVIRSIDTGLTWHDSTQSFRSDWIRFPLPVVQTSATEATWSYTIGAEDLAPGRYLVRVWAIGTDANDPVSNQRHVTITG